MSKLFLAFFVFLAPAAYAGSLASIYNGEQYHLAGYQIIQDSDNPNNFYVLPTNYKVATKSVLKNGAYEKVPQVNHRVVVDGDNTFSIYSIRLKLDQPTQQEMMRAAFALRQKTGADAKIIGMAPICGVTTGWPTGTPLTTEVDPNATFIRYSINSTTSGKCESILELREFNIEVRVPFKYEPQMAQDITSGVGLVLPPLNLLFPYKYKDSVKLTFNARSLYEQMKAGAGLTGTFKAVKAGVEANMSKALNLLQISSQMTVDCQNPDKTICDRFITQASQILSDAIIKYTPLGVTASDNNPLVVGDANKNADATKFKVEMAISDTEVQHIAEFKIDFSNTTYATVGGQAQLNIINVSDSILAPEVRKLMGLP